METSTAASITFSILSCYPLFMHINLMWGKFILNNLIFIGFKEIKVSWAKVGQKNDTH
jgi:hypothetical protein